MIVIKLPTQLRAFADGQKSLEVTALSLGEAFSELDEVAPMIRSQVFDAEGRVRAFVGVFVNSEQLTALGDGSMPLRGGSQVSIVMAVAGG